MHTLAEIRKGTVKKLNGIFVSLLLKIVVIDEEEAEIVRFIFDMYLQGSPTQPLTH